MNTTTDTKPKKERTYEQRQAACKCLKPERRGYIEAAIAHSSDFSDGAFFAFMQERGIDVSELEAFGIDHDCAKSGKVR